MTQRGRYAFITCPGCGKRGYHSKKDAKGSLRASGFQGMSVYPCELTEPQLWHWGHLPVSVKRARIPRSALGRTAPRVPGEYKPK